MFQTKHTVAIIGYPNVGKSCLSNRISQDFRRSLVIDEPGITRDHLISLCEWLNRRFWLIDTGGIEFKPNTSITKQVQSQVIYAIQAAQLVLLVFDNNDQIGIREQHLIQRLLKMKVKLIFVITKCDNLIKQNLSYKTVLPAKIPLIYVSAVSGVNIETLITKIINELQICESQSADKPENELKFALVGKTNAGKSSIAQLLTKNVNRFVISKERNTTRDSLDERFTYHNQEFCLIDTPGLKLYRGQKWIENILYYSYLRSIKAIVESDLVLLIMDITSNLTRQHHKMLTLISSEKKLLILVLNKCDLLSDREIQAKVAEVKKAVSYISWIRIVKICAHENSSATLIKETMLEIWKRNKIYLNRTIMNKFTQQMLQNAQLPRRGKKTLKIHYIYQKKSPQVVKKFIVFVNNIELVTPAFKRFLINNFYAGLTQYLKFLPIELAFMSKR